MAAPLAAGAAGIALQWAQTVYRPEEQLETLPAHNNNTSFALTTWQPLPGDLRGPPGSRFVSSALVRALLVGGAELPSARSFALEPRGAGAKAGAPMRRQRGALGLYEGHR
jgi:hypothetical protein